MSRAAAKRDLKLMIDAGIERKIPVLIGSAGGSGGEPHLAWLLEIVREIAVQGSHRMRVAAIHAEPDRDYLKRQVAQDLFGAEIWIHENDAQHPLAATSTNAASAASSSAVTPPVSPFF